MKASAEPGAGNRQPGGILGLAIGAVTGRSGSTKRTHPAGCGRRRGGLIMGREGLEEERPVVCR